MVSMSVVCSSSDVCGLAYGFTWELAVSNFFSYLYNLSSQHFQQISEVDVAMPDQKNNLDNRQEISHLMDQEWQEMNLGDFLPSFMILNFV